MWCTAGKKILTVIGLSKKQKRHKANLVAFLLNRSVRNCQLWLFDVSIACCLRPLTFR
ncbi:protein of unknown function [Xenorhabdus nematophila AN6/1]|nr:protein of unknown function [Xenorhabdus nematophila AN6/1]